MIKSVAELIILLLFPTAPGLDSRQRQQYKQDDILRGLMSENIKMRQQNLYFNQNKRRIRTSYSIYLRSFICERECHLREIYATLQSNKKKTDGSTQFFSFSSFAHCIHFFRFSFFAFDICPWILCWRQMLKLILHQMYSRRVQWRNTLCHSATNILSQERDGDEEEEKVAAAAKRAIKFNAKSIYLSWWWNDKANVARSTAYRTDQRGLVRKMRLHILHK